MPNNILKSERQLSKTGDTVGVDKKKWFVAIVSNNTELSSEKKLENLGYKTFVPVQEIIYEVNGKRKKRKKVVLATLLFVHVTELERKQIVILPFVKRFMTNVSGQIDSYGKHPLAVIPDEQMNQFRTLVENSDEEIIFESMPRRIGDMVEISEGKLKGLVGNLIQLPDGHSFLAIALDSLGCAKVLISSKSISRKG